MSNAEPTYKHMYMFASVAIFYQTALSVTYFGEKRYDSQPKIAAALIGSSARSRSVCITTNSVGVLESDANTFWIVLALANLPACLGTLRAPWHGTHHHSALCTKASESVYRTSIELILCGGLVR